MQRIASLINAADLGKLMAKENMILIDARTGPDAREKYNAEHPEGAIFVDLETDLAQEESRSFAGRPASTTTCYRFCSIGWAGLVLIHHRTSWYMMIKAVQMPLPVFGGC